MLAGWLAGCKACAINSITINSTGLGWLQPTGCMQGQYSDLAGVSLSD